MRQKPKLRIPPKFMYRFSCSFVSWNALDVYSFSPEIEKIHHVETYKHRLDIR